MKELGRVAGAVALFLIVKILVFIVLSGLLGYVMDMNTTDAAFNSEIVGISTFTSSILVLLILYFWNPTENAKDRWRVLPVKFILVLMVLGFLGVSLNSFILSFFIESQQELLEQSKVLLSSGIVGIISVVVLVPIVEEVVFRRVFIECLIKVTNPYIAIILSALVFGMLHGAPVQMLGASVLGLLFGWMYVQSRSILPSILLHVLNNGFFIYSLSLEDVDVTESYWSVQHPYGWAVAGVTLVAFLMIAYQVNAMSKNISK